MSEDKTAIITVRDIVKSYDSGRVPVLKGITLAVLKGEMVSLWGSSGSGKSTLLHLMGGLDLPDSGALSVCGLDPVREEHRLALRRRHVGFVFQLHNLIPDLTVEENLRVPAMAVGSPVAVARERLHYLADKVGLSHRVKHRIQDLSGGERQRAAICRALMNRPDVVLADEPTGSLDERTGEAVFGLLKNLAETEAITVVIATHERRFAEACHRLIHLRDGRLSE